MNQPVVTRWWWIRHAPVVGTHGRVYGQMDVECDVSDVASFKALAHRVPDGALWFATPLSRTQRTAAAIVAQLKEAGRPVAPEPVIEPAFLEQSFGDWQGKTYREIGAYGQTAEAHRFWLAPATETPPGGESFATVIERVGRMFGEISQRPSCEKLEVQKGSLRLCARAHGVRVEMRASLPNLPDPPGRAPFSR